MCCASSTCTLESSVVCLAGYAELRMALLPPALRHAAVVHQAGTNQVHMGVGAQAAGSPIVTAHAAGRATDALRRLLTAGLQACVRATSTVLLR